jgi:hypothetical protein
VAPIRGNYRETPREAMGRQRAAADLPRRFSGLR